MPQTPFPLPPNLPPPPPAPWSLAGCQRSAYTVPASPSHSRSYTSFPKSSAGEPHSGLICIPLAAASLRPPLEENPNLRRGSYPEGNPQLFLIQSLVTSKVLALSVFALVSPRAAEGEGPGQVSNREKPHTTSPLPTKVSHRHVLDFTLFCSLSRLFWRRKKYHREEGAGEGRWSWTAGTGKGRAGAGASASAQGFCFRYPNGVWRKRGQAYGRQKGGRTG